MIKIGGKYINKLLHNINNVVKEVKKVNVSVMEH